MAEANKLLVSVWINQLTFPELKRLQEQAKHLRAAFPAIGQEPKWMAAGMVCKDHGIEVWPVLDIAANNEQVQSGLVAADFLDGLASSLQGMIAEGHAKGLCLNLSKIADLKGLEASLLRLAQHFEAKGLPLIMTLQPGALDAATGQGLARHCQRLQLCFATPPKAGPIFGSQGFKDSLGPWVAAAGAAKLEVVLPGHGWSLPKDGWPLVLEWDAWTATVAQHGPERRDPVSAELHLSLPDKEVWIADSIAFSAKLWQLRELGITQVCFSGLGQEDPRLWALIDTLPEPFLS